MKLIIKLALFFSLISIYVATSGYAQKTAQDPKLKFKPDKAFRILQFTDIHWDSNIPASCRLVETLLNSVILAEKPDLIVFTGDIVTVSPAREGWLSIGKLMQYSGIPWAVTLGNHDDETDLSRENIFDLLETMPGFLGRKGSVSGVGNYVLPIQASSGDGLAALLYFLDSQAYTAIADAGYYDWFRFDQIQWYRNESIARNDKTKTDRLPALAFFHIPTPEWDRVFGNPGTIGLKNETVSSAAINPGMVASFIEMGDVMGAFVGHDHVNNYIGLYHGVALAYGQKTGFNSYGDLPKGGRVIELTEGERTFKTWIRTPEGEMFHYFYPYGVSFREQDYQFMSPTTNNDLKPGLKYSYHEGKFTSVDELMKSEVLKSGIVKVPEISSQAEKDYFGYVFEGFIEVKKKGLYRFSLKSDDGSVLWIGGKELINNDGTHGSLRKDAAIALDAGFHAFKLCYFDESLDQLLELNMAILGQEALYLKEEYFFHSSTE